MTTDVIGTGGAFTTIAAWEADIPATLTARREGLLKNQKFSESVDFSGHTTTAALDIILRTDTNASFKDNLTPGTDAFFYNDTLGAAIERTAAYTNVIDYGATEHVTIRGVMLKHTSTGSGANITTGSAAAARSWIFDDCIISTPGNERITWGGDGSYMSNCLIIAAGDVFNLQGGDVGPLLVNCGFECTSTGDVVGTAQYTAPTFRNCWAMSFTNWFTTAPTSVDCPNCATDMAAINNGTGDSTGEKVNLTEATSFVSTVDFTLKSGSDMEDGATRQQTYTNDLDIIGQTRDLSTPDIGPWEFQAAGGEAATPKGPLGHPLHGPLGGPV